MSYVGLNRRTTGAFTVQFHAVTQYVAPVFVRWLRLKQSGFVIRYCWVVGLLAFLLHVLFELLDVLVNGLLKFIVFFN